MCSLDVSFAFATVRGWSREGCMAVPMVSSAKVVTFGGSTCRIASFRVAGVALCDTPTCFITRRKPFCRRNTLASFSEAELQFSWQVQHFGDLHCHLRRVVSCVF